MDWKLRCVPTDAGNGIFCDGSMSVVVIFDYTGNGPDPGTQVEAVGYDESVITVDPTTGQTTQHRECTFRISCTGKHCGETFNVTFHADNATDTTFTGSCKKVAKDNERSTAIRVTIEIEGLQITKSEPLAANARINELPQKLLSKSE